ncbi:MAG: hypothetical protein AAFQ82_02895, partial [Myxococcota bacterium]
VAFDGSSILLVAGAARTQGSMGAGSVSFFDDVWRYDGTTWEEVPVSTPVPSPEGHRFVYNPDAQRLWLINGGEVFEFSENELTRIGIDPAFAQPGAAAYDQSNGQAVFRVGSETAFVSMRNDDRLALSWSLTSLGVPVDGVETLDLRVVFAPDSIPPGGELDLDQLLADDGLWQRIGTSVGFEISTEIRDGRWNRAVNPAGEWVAAVRSRYGVTNTLSVDYAELRVRYRLEDFGTCGDGIVQSNEACDPANSQTSQGCSDSCSFAGTCGNGIRETGERCDDGNPDNNDGCTTRCVRDGCCEPQSGPGCLPWHSDAVESCVCDERPECCTERWDSSCVTLAVSEGCAPGCAL